MARELCNPRAPLLSGEVGGTAELVPGEGPRLGERRLKNLPAVSAETRRAVGDPGSLGFAGGCLGAHLAACRSGWGR